MMPNWSTAGSAFHAGDAGAPSQVASDPLGAGRTAASRHCDSDGARRRRCRFCLVATATVFELLPMASSQTGDVVPCTGCHASVGAALPLVVPERTRGGPALGP